MNADRILDDIDRAMKTLDKYEPLFVSDDMFPKYAAFQGDTDDGPVIFAHPDYWAKVIQACKAKRPALVDHAVGDVFRYHGVPLVDLQSPDGRKAAARIAQAFMPKATGPARTTAPLDRSPTFL